MLDHPIRNKKTFFKWLLSYILILIIPFILNALAYARAISIIEDEINTAHMASLKQLQQVMDSRLLDIERLALEISLNKEVDMLLRHRGTIEGKERLKMVNIIKELHTYKVSNSFIDQLFIYSINNDFILSSKAKYTTKEFYNFYNSDYLLDYDQWIQFLQGNKGQGYITIGKNTKGKQLREIAYIKLLPISPFSQLHGAVVGTINEKVILEAIQTIKWAYGDSIVVLDENCNVIISNNLEGRYCESIDTLLNNCEAIAHTNLDGQDMIISYVTSDITNWKYISILPKDVFMNKVRYIKNVIFISICICLGFGGFIAYYLCKKNYNPIQKIMELLINKGGIQFKKREDELKFIQDSILSVIEEKQKINAILDKQNYVMRDNFLSRLAKGKISMNTPIQDICENYRIEFNSEYFAVMLFYVEDYNCIFFNESTPVNMDPLEMCQFIIKNIVEEMIEKYSGVGYVIEIDNVLACIASLISKDNASETLQEIAYKSREFVKDAFNIECVISISDIHLGYEGISLAYEEAMETLEYIRIMSIEQIMHYQELLNFSKNQYGSTLDEQKKFINAMTAGNYKEAKDIFNRLVDTEITKGMPSIQVLRCKMFGLVNTMAMAMEEATVHLDREFWDKLKPIDRLLECETIKELKTQMNNILSKIDKHVKLIRHEKEEGLLDQLVLYIDNNYNNPDISVSSIAERFDINISYLSRYFKENMNVGVLEYIHKLRIKNAKEIMDNSDTSVKDVAVKVGYYNSVAFIRAFKRYEGITPGQYRIKKKKKSNPKKNSNT